MEIIFKKSGLSDSDFNLWNSVEFDLFELISDSEEESAEIIVSSSDKAEEIICAYNLIAESGYKCEVKMTTWGIIDRPTLFLSLVDAGIIVTAQPTSMELEFRHYAHLVNAYKRAVSVCSANEHMEPSVIDYYTRLLEQAVETVKNKYYGNGGKNV